MQTRRAFLFNGLVNIAAFATGGTLAVNGKKQFKKAVKSLEGSQGHDTENPVTVPKESTVDAAADFVIGGVLGLVAKIAIEKSIELKHTNKGLSAVVSKLQQLDKNDLPGIERTLQEFVRKEDIRYETNKDSDRIKSISGLLEAILIHVDSQKKAVQPFLDELKMLRGAITEPFIRQSQSVVDQAIKEASVESFKGENLKKYLGTTIINALQSSGAGEKIGKNAANYLEGINLVSEDGVTAAKLAVTEALGSDEIREAFKYGMSNEITEFDIAGRLMRALVHKYKISLQDDDPDLVAFKHKLAEAFESEGVSKNLSAAICAALADPNMAKELIKIRQQSLSEKS